MLTTRCVVRRREDAPSLATVLTRPSFRSSATDTSCELPQDLQAASWRDFTKLRGRPMYSRQAAWLRSSWCEGVAMGLSRAHRRAGRLLVLFPRLGMVDGLTINRLVENVALFEAALVGLLYGSTELAIHSAQGQLLQQVTVSTALLHQQHLLPWPLVREVEADLLRGGVYTPPFLCPTPRLAAPPQPPLGFPAPPRPERYRDGCESADVDATSDALRAELTVLRQRIARRRRSVAAAVAALRDIVSQHAEAEVEERRPPQADTSCGKRRRRTDNVSTVRITRSMACRATRSGGPRARPLTCVGGGDSESDEDDAATRPWRRMLLKGRRLVQLTAEDEIPGPPGFAPVVRHSGALGRYVVAGGPIEPDTDVQAYVGRVSRTRGAAGDSDKVLHFCTRRGRGCRFPARCKFCLFIDGERGGNWTALVAHSSARPNCVFDGSHFPPRLRTSPHAVIGEETVLSVDYGSAYEWVVDPIELRGKGTDTHGNDCQ